MSTRENLLEVCSNSIQSAVNAEIAGADRIELCENLLIGGTTPSVGCIKTVRRLIKLPINVLIRPRGGDFLYSEYEFEQIKEDIISAKSLGVQGIVCGLLQSNGHIDIERTKQLVELAKPLTFTFHRAFDFTPNAFEALNDVISTGATHILTSGQQNKACNAVELLTQLVELARNRIKIIIGSGVNQNTIISLTKTRAKEYHMSGAENLQSEMKFRPSLLTLNAETPKDYTIQTSSIQRIKTVINLL